MTSIVSFDSHGVRCEGTWFSGGDGARPCVVMAHGFGACRDGGLAPFAERFAAAGLHALTFDYRGFGTSDGDLRQDVDHRRHREDYHAALAYVRGREDVDARRVALWGTSYSGGHVIAVAARDGEVRAVVSQGAAMDGLAALFGVKQTSGGGKTMSLTTAGLRDIGRQLTGRAPYLVPISGPPGSDAVISAPGGEEGFAVIQGPTFRNEMCARGILRIALNRPVRRAARVTCPVLLVAAERDNIAPVGSVHRVAELLDERAELLSFDCSHFDIYVGEVFDQSSAAQVEFLRQHLA